MTGRLGPMADFDQTTLSISWVLSGLLLIPYLTWGVFLLRQRLVHDVELDRAVETFTVAALIFFFIFEFSLLQVWLANSPVKMIFSTLGLAASGLALYGPLLASFTSHLLVDLVMPQERFDPNVPQYGAAAGCEMRGDFAAAADQYAAIARMFPKDGHAPVRAADNFMKVAEVEKAIPYFKQGMRNARNASEALRIANRLCEIYQRQLGQTHEAKEVLATFLDRFPDCEYAHSVQLRIERLQNPSSSPFEHHSQEP